MSRLWGTLFPKIKSDTDHQNELKQVQRGLVARYSRGNVRLQQAKYLTEEEKEELKKRALE